MGGGVEVWRAEVALQACRRERMEVWSSGSALEVLCKCSDVEVLRYGGLEARCRCDDMDRDIVVWNSGSIVNVEVWSAGARL